MGGLFSKPKALKPPAPAPPLAVPEVGEEVGERARRRQPRGRRATFLTGELVPDTGKKKELG